MPTLKISRAIVARTIASLSADDDAPITTEPDNGDRLHPLGHERVGLFWTGDTGPALNVELWGSYEGTWVKLGSQSDWEPTEMAAFEVANADFLFIRLIGVSAVTNVEIMAVGF
jgi:hypothetical protein